MILLTTTVTVFSPSNFASVTIIPVFMKYMILLSNVIPVSMRVNMEFAKLVYSRMINRDNDIQGTLARNSNIPESLGRIQYILTDKTGTITKNEMTVRKISLGQQGM